MISLVVEVLSLGHAGTHFLAGKTASGFPACDVEACNLADLEGCNDGFVGSLSAVRWDLVRGGPALGKLFSWIGRGPLDTNGTSKLAGQVVGKLIECR